MNRLDLMEFIEVCIDEEHTPTTAFYKFQKEFPDDKVGIKRAEFERAVSEAINRRELTAKAGALFVAHDKLNRRRRAFANKLVKQFADVVPGNIVALDDAVTLVNRIGDMAMNPATPALAKAIEELLAVMEAGTGLRAEAKELFDIED